MASYFLKSLIVTLVISLISNEFQIESTPFFANQTEKGVVDIDAFGSLIEKQSSLALAEFSDCQLICEGYNDGNPAGRDYVCTWSRTESTCSVVTQETLRNAKYRDAHFFAEAWRNLVDNKLAHRIMISHPNITALEFGFLQDYKGISVFECTDTQLSDIDDGTFSGMVHIMDYGQNVLDLSGNQLISLRAGIFKGIEKINELYLQKNRIQVIEKNSFANLTKVLIIDLSFNEINYLDHHIFNANVELQELKLSGNLLRNVPSLILPSHSFRSLDLDRNEFEELWITAVSMEYLNLSRNRLKVFDDFDNGVSISNRNLKDIDLSLNDLTSYTLPTLLGQQGLKLQMLKNIRLQGNTV